MRLRLQPIRVFCLHHVCAKLDVEYMNDYDWMQIDEFKHKVKTMQQEGIEFISLTKVYEHLNNDKFRILRYVALTFDDGWASVKEILPWLEEQHIPVTLFINGKYTDGQSYRRKPKEQYMTLDEIFQLTSPLIEIGSHGWKHVKASELDMIEFEKSVGLNDNLLGTHPNYVHFWAYPYGAHSIETDIIIKSKGYIPVYMDGRTNIYNQNIIHRESL